MTRATAAEREVTRQLEWVREEASKARKSIEGLEMIVRAYDQQAEALTTRLDELRTARQTKGAQA